MEEHHIKIVGLCQVNDIIPIINSVNNLPKKNQEAARLVEIYDINNEAINVPTVEAMENFIRSRGLRKKGYDISNIKRYLLLSSLHNRGAGCGGTSPLISPLAVYLVEEDGTKSGGIYCSLTVAYNKLRELVEKHFTEVKTKEPLIVVTPDLNKNILKKQLRPGKLPINVKIEEMVGECIKSIL